MLLDSLLCTGWESQLNSYKYPGILHLVSCTTQRGDFCSFQKIPRGGRDHLYSLTAVTSLYISTLSVRWKSSVVFTGHSAAATRAFCHSKWPCGNSYYVFGSGPAQPE